MKINQLLKDPIQRLISFKNASLAHVLEEFKVEDINTHRIWQRFKFCGDSDCPDWILVQINTLARMSSIKMKLLCQLVAESITDAAAIIDYEKIKKLTADAKFDEDEVKATVSALTFILTSSARFGVIEATLANELQQIGFPREHSQALCRVYSERLPALTAHLRSTSLRTSRLVDVKTRPSTNSDDTDVTLTYWNAETDRQHSQTFTASPAQLALLIDELKSCSEKLQTLENEV